MTLHADLASTLTAFGDIQMIRHRLVHIPYNGPEMDDLVNQVLVKKTQQVEAALMAKKPERFILLHERPYRMQALCEVVDLGLLDEPARYWRCVAHQWGTSENIFENLDAWIALWTADVPDRHLAMDEDDRDLLKTLPRRMSIYRGYQGAYHTRGLSWSWKRSQAEWFAKRHAEHRPDQPYVALARVHRSKIVACFVRESELVILPEDIDDLSPAMYEIARAG